MSPDPPSAAQLEALLAEKAALRRVATIVAGDPDAGRLFDGVCQELGRLLEVDSANIQRFEGHVAAAATVPLVQSEQTLGQAVPAPVVVATGNLHVRSTRNRRYR